MKKNKKDKDIEKIPEDSQKAGIISSLNAALREIGKTFSFKTGPEGKEKSHINDIKKAFGHLRGKAIGWAVVVGVFLVYLLSGIYVVNPGKEAVIRRFGKRIDQRITEGMHYRLPWPIDKVDIVNVQTIRREGLGMEIPEHEATVFPPSQIQLLTGDENIIDFKAIFQYKIKDPGDYLFNVKYPACPLIRVVARYVLTNLIGSMNIDDILTIGKLRLQTVIQKETQEILDLYGSGLQLISVNLQEVYPPSEVADAFRDVASAKEDKAKAINDARGFANSLIPEARGQAQELLSEAEGFAMETVNRAKGDAGKFDKMYAEYRKSKDVTERRLYLETMEKVLSRAEKYVLDTKNKKVNLRFLQGE